jgi:hypothetical protein
LPRKPATSPEGAKETLVFAEKAATGSHSETLKFRKPHYQTTTAFICTGNDLLSHAPSRAVDSAQPGLTLKRFAGVTLSTAERGKPAAEILSVLF